MGIVYNNTGKSVACKLFTLYLVAKEFPGSFKGKFWCSVSLLFYLEAIYLPVLKSFCHIYEMLQMNRLWISPIYIPELILLLNDLETNPGPRIVDPTKTIAAPYSQGNVEVCGTANAGTQCVAMSLSALVYNFRNPITC